MSLPEKVIIIAAGQGRRCRPLTESVPKPLLQVNGRSVLEHQIDALTSNGIKEFVLIRGYKAEAFQRSDIRYYYNARYKENNVLNSLMVAETELDRDCLVSYGDIVYTSGVVKAAVQSTGDFVLMVDTAWRERYVGRRLHPVSEAEKVIVDDRGMLRCIGKQIPDTESVYGEFIGVARLTAHGCKLIRHTFHSVKSQLDGGPFQEARTFQEACLSDLFQEMVDLGHSIHTVPIEGNWVEIDTIEDYEYAIKVFNSDGR